MGEEVHHSIHSLRRGGGPFHSFSELMMRTTKPFILCEKEEGEEDDDDGHSIHTPRLLSYNNWSGVHPPVTMSGLVIFLRILSESEWNGPQPPSYLLSDSEWDDPPPFRE